MSKENDKPSEERLDYGHGGCCDDYHKDHCEDYWESGDHCKYYGGYCCDYDDCPKKKCKKHKKHCGC